MSKIKGCDLWQKITSSPNFMTTKPKTMTDEIKELAAQMLEKWAQDSEKIAAQLEALKIHKSELEAIGLTPAKLRSILEANKGGRPFLHPNHVFLLLKNVTKT